jgi:hypothetical protein
VSWRARNPNLLALSRLLCSVCLQNIFSMTSNRLPVVDKRLIRLKFWGNLWSLPCFSKVITFASFQDVGKWDSRRQWLNKCVKCTNGLLERYLRRSFGMPSIPQPFPNFKEFINFCKSQGQILWGGGGLVVYGFEQSLNSSLQPPSMVFITQVMGCELIFQAVNNCLGFL